LLVAKEAGDAVAPEDLMSEFTRGGKMPERTIGRL